ncbi:unnamed protein product, partial [Symbiodinium sp. KB8]
MYWILGAIFSFFEAFLGFDLHKVTIGTLKTTVYGVQWLVLARLWRWLQVRYVGTVKFYLNVVIKNKKEVVRSQARERSRVAGKILGKIANHFLTDDAFSEKLAGNLEKSMPKRLQDELGVTATVAKQFQRGNFLVLLVSIEQIDMRKMIASKSSEKMLKRFDKFMQFLSHLPSWVMMDLQNLVLLQVGNGLVQKMPENMTRQLRDAGGVEVEVESRRPEEEAELFFTAMKQMESQTYCVELTGPQLSVGLRLSEDGELLGPWPQLILQRFDASLDAQFGERGLVPLLVKGLQGLQIPLKVLVAGILKNVSNDERNQQLMLGSDILGVIHELLQSGDEQLLIQITALLRNLLSSPGHHEEHVDVLLEPICRSLSDHCGVTSLVTRLAFVLGSFTAIDEDARQKFACELGGIPLLTSLLEKYWQQEQSLRPGSCEAAAALDGTAAAECEEGVTLASTGSVVDTLLGILSTKRIVNSEEP